MKTKLGKASAVVAWFYAILVILWFVLHNWLGDMVWWLALPSVFTPFFFTPLVVILPVSFVFRQHSLWASVVSPLSIFLLLYGHLFLPAWPSDSISTQMFLVKSFNIWGYSRSEETAYAILEDETPDIIVLQELAPEMAEVLIREIGDLYPYHAIKINEHKYGVGVFSRYPLVELNSSNLSDPNWQIQICRVEVEDRVFILYNVHLQVSNVLVYLEEKSPIADKVRSGYQNRQVQVQRLVADVLTQTEPVIVAGDFNSTDQSDIYDILIESLTDAHRAVGWGFGHTFPSYGGSWHGIPIIPRQMRIDMIFYSEGFYALKSTVGSYCGESDHLPVSAQLAWQE